MIFSNSNKYKQFIKGPYGFLTDLFLFALITYVFHLVFRFFAADIMAVPFIEASGNWLADRVFEITLWINRNILRMHVTDVPGNTMFFTNSYGMNVNSSCSGLKQFYQALVLFILFPGPWKHKVWFIPFSLAVMFLTNIFRNVALSIIQSINPAYFAFSHDWILRPFFYVVLFGLWVVWVEKYRQKSN